MAYEAIIYDQEGKAKADVRAIFDRAWVLNGYEQCSFSLSVKTHAAHFEDFTFGNHLVITDDQLDIWGGYFDPPQPWSSNRVVSVNSYSGERIFETRAWRSDLLLKGTAGSIYRQIIERMNSVLPWSTLMRPGNIYGEGNSREETISAKKLYDDVLRIASRSGNEFYVEPVVDNGLLHYEGHWYARRGAVKDFALEEGVNIEAKENVMEYQGEIWNYIYAFGNGATWNDRKIGIAFDQASIEKYGPRMYPLAVDALEQSTVQASANAFLNYYAWPRRTFNLSVGGKRVREEAAMAVFKNVRIGDVVDLHMYSVDYQNGRPGVDTSVRITGLTHHGKRNIMDLTANEVRL